MCHTWNFDEVKKFNILTSFRILNYVMNRMVPLYIPEILYTIRIYLYYVVGSVEHDALSRWFFWVNSAKINIMSVKKQRKIRTSLIVK